MLKYSYLAYKIINTSDSTSFNKKKYTKNLDFLENAFLSLLMMVVERLVIFIASKLFIEMQKTLIVWASNIDAMHIRKLWKYFDNFICSLAFSLTANAISWMSRNSHNDQEITIIWKLKWIFDRKIEPLEMHVR